MSSAYAAVATWKGRALGWGQRWWKWLTALFATIISGIVVKEVQPIRDFIAGILKASGHWLTARYEIQHWYAWLLGLGFVSFIVLTAWPRVRRRSITRYTEDEFLGLRWKWRFAKSEKLHAIVSGSMTPFCIACNVRAHFKSWEYVENSIAVIPIMCPECGAVVRVPGDSQQTVQSRVTGLVEREILSGAWKTKQREQTPLTVWHG